MHATEDVAPAAWAQLRRRRQLELGGELEAEVARASIAASLFTRTAAQPASVGRYRLRHRLGAGGMGIVFAGHDPTLKRDVAIKLLHPRNDSADASTRLLTEAQNTARLIHPSVVTIYDVGVHEERVFIAMELIEGESMAEWLLGRPPWRECVAVLARAARGIEAAHQRGVVHRDFKPANVLLGRDGRVCVADFGLAREVSDPSFTGASRAGTGVVDLALTRSGDVAGTPAYMAPEQYLGTLQDERTDQFAFCVSLYEALFGRRPFEASSMAELREAILDAQPVIPAATEIPAELVQAVSRGLSKSRRDRFASMGELAALLEATSLGVDLSRVLRGEEPSQPSAKLKTSAYAAYLRQLPAGLDTSPEQRLPSPIYQVVLATRPLRNPPAELVPILERLPSTPAIPAAHARAILSAIYDEHFDSLDQWRTFFGEISRGAVRLLMTSVTIPKPSSPYFIRGLMATYNNHASGIRMEVAESAQGSATLRMSHPPNTLNDVAHAAWEEFIRAVLQAAGARFLELVTVERGEAGFVTKVQWR